MWRRKSSRDDIFTYQKLSMYRLRVFSMEEWRMKFVNIFTYENKISNIWGHYLKNKFEWNFKHLYIHNGICMDFKKWEFWSCKEWDRSVMGETIKGVNITTNTKIKTKRKLTPNSNLLRSTESNELRWTREQDGEKGNEHL